MTPSPGCIPRLHETGNIRIVRARDCYLYDEDGRQYIDFEAGLRGAGLGHGREELAKVLGSQAGEMMHPGSRLTGDLRERLSRQMLELLGLHEGESFFLGSGSEAVSLAITIARALSGRKKILRLGNSCPGTRGPSGSLAANPDTVLVPVNQPIATSKICLTDIAALVLEPGIAGGLIHFPPGEFVAGLLKAARENGAYLIADELTTGFGRTGKWFGFEHYGMKPDMAACGNVMGNGYPVSAACVNSETARGMEEGGLVHARSRQYDPLGCALAIEVIRIMKKECLVGKARESGRLFRELLEVLAEKYTEITEVRGRGLMLALEFESASFSEQVSGKLLEKGYVAGSKDRVMNFMPPLTIRDTDIIKLLRALEEILGGIARPA